MGNNQLNKHFSSYVFRTPSASILNSVIGTGIVTVADWSIDKSDEFFFIFYSSFLVLNLVILSSSQGELERNFSPLHWRGLGLVPFFSAVR